MGPLTWESLQEKLAAHQSERRLATLGQLWEAFGLRWAFLESAASHGFAATVVAESGVGNLKDAAGMLSLHLTPFHAVSGSGVRERAENTQIFLMVGEKELHLNWPGSLSAMLADEQFHWLARRLASGAGSS
jgi:hypothetical protein